MNMVAATGHLNCTKGARLYLQKMVKLEAYYPWVYQHFTNKSFYCISRTDKFWAGLLTDLVIEQTVMEPLKILGGLIKGRGMDKNKRNLWAVQLFTAVLKLWRRCTALPTQVFRVVGNIKSWEYQDVKKITKIYKSFMVG